MSDLRELRHMPRVTVNLMHSETKANDPFFSRIVREFFASARSRHPRFPVVRALEHGVALCELPASYVEYFMAIEAAGRRNVKKAERLGYTFRRLAFNDYLDDIGAIRRSTPRRQGEMPREWREGEVRPCTDPASRTGFHDYPYFGIFKGPLLTAYAGCLVSGELCMIEHILGHADHLGDGVVPMLVTGMAREVLEKYPAVRYYAYGTFFGGGASMRRFKKKFLFFPHRVKWVLG